VTEIVLVRHGETDWNVEERFQGHADPPLNARGREQARVLAARMAGEHVDVIYTSPLRRARETAEILAEALGATVVSHDGLREVDVGEWQGLTRGDIEERFPEAFARWREYGPGWEHGETYEQMADRVLAAMREIASAQQSGRVVVVTHGGPVRAIAASADGISHAESRRRTRVIDNCGVAGFAIVDGKVRPVH
jgi:probable phosphoglycerate mutase